MTRCDLTYVDHRPYPLLPSSWSMTMTWHDLLFAHWAVEAKVLRPLIPQELQLDIFDGTAWLGVVPFRMSGIRMRGYPPIPTTTAFAELNVRTYVTAGGKPGIWFFSLDAASTLAVIVARRFWHLPYFGARMSCKTDGENVSYQSQRKLRGCRTALFAATYRPAAPPVSTSPGSQEHFFTERYCFYARHRRGTILRGDIHHAPWPLQAAEAQISRNSMADPIGITLRGPPQYLHFARRLDVVAWPLTKLGIS